LRHTDKILVINHGELVEQGSHEELLALGGLYRQLYELQSQQQSGTLPGERVEGQRELARPVAQQAASAVENRRSLPAKAVLVANEEQIRRLGALDELSQALAGARTIEDVYRIAASKTCDILPADRTSIALGSVDDHIFDLLALHEGRGISRVRYTLPSEGTVLGIAVKAGRIVVVHETAQSARPHMKSFMVAPLKAGGRTFGAFNVGALRPNAFGEQEVRLMVEIASLVAATIESKRLFVRSPKRVAKPFIVSPPMRGPVL
jgi:GAF domain-containing protein